MVLILGFINKKRISSSKKINNFRYLYDTVPSPKKMNTLKNQLGYAESNLDNDIFHPEK